MSPRQGYKPRSKAACPPLHNPLKTQKSHYASLANATLGVMASASLAVSIIGQALAQALGSVPKHAIKQVDRLLSNAGIVVWDIFGYWVPEVIGTRTSAVIAMDWTDFDADDQTTLSLVTGHGRATPLLWLSVHKQGSSQNLFQNVR